MVKLILGTRPDVPENLSEEYKIIIDIFRWCTEADYLNRPDAKDLINSIEAIMNK